MLIQDLFCNPGLSGDACYGKTLMLSFYPVFRRDFLDEVSFRLLCSLPEGSGFSFRVLLAETICFLRPCDSIAERTFPFSGDLLKIGGAESPVSDFGSPVVQTRRSDRVGS
jgi:hypothetical protein